jgi:hypothetical protein
MRPEQYNIAMSVLSDVEKVINNHSPMTQKDTAEMLIEFMKKSREIAGDKSYLSTMQDAIINLNRQMFEYTRNISNAPLMLDRAHAAQIKALELSQVSREGFRDNVKSAEQIFGYLSDLGIVGGDESGTLASEVASMWHLYFKENGYTNMASKTFNRMNDIDRVRFSGFDAVRNHNNLVPKKAVPKKVAQKEPEEGLFAKALPAVVGIATMSATGSATMAAGASAATAAVVSKKARTKVTEKTASSLKNVGKVLASRPGKIAVGQRMATGAEEYMSDKLQNFTKRGHNRED